MSVNSNVLIKIFDKNSLDYKEVSLDGQDNSIASIFLDPIIRHTDIKLDIHKLLTAEEIDILNIREINEFTICSDIISASILLEIMEKIHNKLLIFEGNASEILEVYLGTIEELQIDEVEKKETKVGEIQSYLLFADTFGKLTGILTVAKVFNSNVQIEITYG